LTPFNMDNPDMDLKRSGGGKDAVVCCKHGEPIYRKGFYDPTMIDIDEFIAHTNGEDIRNTMVEGTKEAEADFIGSMLGETPKQPDNQIDLEDSIAEVEAEDKIAPLEQQLDELLDKPSVEEREILETPESNPFDDADDDDIEQITPEVLVDQFPVDEEELTVEEETEFTL